MEISIGILIIGSLYWDDNTPRTQWRHERLDFSTPRYVLAPIRYGRRSQSRGYSYTMVFSHGVAREEANLGRAIVVPCKRSVQRTQDLVEEAEALWAAERNVKSSNGCISAGWGRVALLVNPARPLPDALRDGWTDRVSQEQSYGNFDHTEDEEAIVGRAGVLNVPWPKCTDGSPLELSGLLATATKPTLVDKRYPTAQQIANAWGTPDGSSYVDYFLKNREHKITTFQDREIETCLDAIQST